MVFLGIAEFLCLIGIPVTLIGFFIQLARKKPSKKSWGVTLIAFLAVFVICVAVTPPSDSTDKEDSTDKISVAEEDKPTETVENSKETEQPVSESEETSQYQQEVEKTEAEKFAESNDVSVELAESLEAVLMGMELTDKSRVGVFHYDLSHVYDWKQIDDWAEGERYSVYMDMEHIWYIYVKNDVVVGVRDGRGNIFYSE